MVSKYLYYVRKYQLVTCDNSASRQALEAACVQNGRVISFFFLPILVDHTAYETPEIAQICQIFPSRSIQSNAILELGQYSPKVLNVFCTRLNVSLRRQIEGGYVFNKRLILLASRFGTNAETMCTQISRLGVVRLKFKADEPEAFAWRITNVTANTKVRVPNLTEIMIPNSPPRGGRHSSGGI